MASRAREPVPKKKIRRISLCSADSKSWYVPRERERVPPELGIIFLAGNSSGGGYDTGVRHLDALPRPTARHDGLRVVFFFLQAANSVANVVAGGVGTREQQQRQQRQHRQQRQERQPTASPIAAKTFRAPRCVGFYERRKRGEGYDGRYERYSSCAEGCWGR